VGVMQALGRHMTSAIDAAFDGLVCPLTNMLPVDPVTAEDDKVYERSAIIDWLKEQKTSPMTKEPMGETLKPATQVQNMIRTMVKSGAITGDKAAGWRAKLEEELVDDLREQARQGDGKAMYNLGMSYQHGRHGLAKDLATAIQWFEKSHSHGEASGTACLGYCYLTGQGAKKSGPFGAVLLTEAAIKGSKFAAYFLGVCFAEGKLDFPKQTTQATRWYATVARASINDLSAADQEKAAAWLKALAATQSQSQQHAAQSSSSTEPTAQAK